MLHARTNGCFRALASVAVLLLLSGARPTVAGAQEQSPDARRSALSGQVTAPSGEPLSAVNVQVPSLGRGTVTGEDGRYRLEGLSPRRLKVRFSRIGYGADTRTVELSPGAVRRLDVRLDVRAVVSRDITVTGTPTASDPLRVPQEVDIVGSEEMQSVGSSSLGKVLTEKVTGVSSISTGSQVGKPVLRGLSGKRVKVLQDGVSQESFQYGVRHSPPTSMSEAERVEVVRGPASVLYGSDALGGAVNVISKSLPSAPAGETHAGGRVAGGYQSGNEERTGSADVHLATGPLGLRAGVERRVADDLTTPETGTFFEEGGQPGPFGLPKYAGEVPFTNFEQSLDWAIDLRKDVYTGRFLARHDPAACDSTTVSRRPRPTSGRSSRSCWSGASRRSPVLWAPTSAWPTAWRWPRTRTWASGRRASSSSTPAGSTAVWRPSSWGPRTWSRRGRSPWTSRSGPAPPAFAAR